MLELIGLQEDLVKRTSVRIFENRAGNDLSATAVVFPSKRFGFFLRQELASGMEGNFFPPALFPIEIFFESLFKLNFPGSRILDELEAAHAVYESAGAVFKDGMYGSRRIADFASFLPWAQKILAALEEILTEGGRIEAIDFGKYNAFAALGDYHRSYKDFIQKIPELLADIGRRLDDRKQATKGMVSRKIAGLAEKKELQIPGARHWIFSGFNAMNACERKLYRFFDEHNGACLILRTDPKGMADPLSPFRLQEETIRGLGMARPSEPVASGAWDDLAAKVTLQPCDSVESEIYHAFSKLEEICRGRDETALRKIAVLLPSSPSLIPFVQGAVSRFDQEAKGLPFNITLGYPLERTPMMQLVDALLAIVENQPNAMIKAGDYLQLIRHPYVKISGNDGDREPLKRGIHLLENIIDKGNLTGFSIDALEKNLKAEMREPAHGIDTGLAAEIIAQVSSLHGRFIPPVIRDMPSLLVFLRRALESVGSKKNRGSHLFLNEYAAAALDVMEELEDFTSSHEKVFHAADTTAIAALVRSHFRGRTIRFEGSPLQGVQVMGPLEFRGLSFDHVLVLDAVEGVLPGTTKYDPILPDDIRAIFGIRDHGDWEKVYAFNFFAMIGAAKGVHILYPRKSEDGQECERSRFIERIAFAIEKKTMQAPTAISVPLPFDIVPHGLKRVKKNPAIGERLGAVTLSPSSLETYVRCPLQFYFSRILGLKEREEVSPETDGGLIGTITHDALQNFYKKYSGAGMMAKAGEKVLAVDLEHCLFEAFRKLNFDPQKGLERIRAWTLLEQLRLFIREDLQRMEEHGIRIEKQEKTLHMDFSVPGLEHKVHIKGRLDRCETQGSLLRVIDYKTGPPFLPRVRLNDTLDLKDLFQREEKEYGAALAAFRKKYPGMQLQVYLILLASEQGRAWDELAAAFVFLREKNGKMVQDIFRTGGRNPRPFTADEQQEAMAAFVNDLCEIIRDIHCREYFLPNPADEKVCAYCPFRLPCGNL
jgi:ATP-dependent helicase/nuclease subunit B